MSECGLLSQYHSSIVVFVLNFNYFKVLENPFFQCQALAQLMLLNSM
jgi:hypothetical protein